MSGSTTYQTSYSSAVPERPAVTGGSKAIGRRRILPDGSSILTNGHGMSKFWSTSGIPYDAVKNDDTYIWLRDKSGKVYRRRHGFKATYSAGCRCDPCFQGYSHTSKKNDYKIHRQGGAHSYPIQEIRDAIADLRRRKIGYTEIARLSGLSYATVFRIDQGRKGVKPQVTVSKRVGDLILGITGEDNRKTMAYVEASLSIKRMQSMIALGYTPCELYRMAMGGDARPSGESAWTKMIRCPGTVESVRVYTAEAIRKVYQMVGDTPVSDPDPVDHTAWAVIHHHKRMRKKAADNGWEPPASWEDPGTLQWPSSADACLDSASEATSSVDWVLVERMANGERHRSTFDEKVEAVRLMLQRDVGRNEIRRQLGISTQTWRKIEGCL